VCNVMAWMNGAENGSDHEDPPKTFSRQTKMALGTGIHSTSFICSATCHALLGTLTGFLVPDETPREMARSVRDPATMQ
jgi:hypothetical protein